MSELIDDPGDFYYRISMPEYRMGYAFDSESISEHFNVWMEKNLFNHPTGKWIVQHSMNHTTFLEI